MEKGAREDYVFHYRLEAEGKGQEPVYHERLLEMLRAQLAHILNLAVPVRGTEEVKLDGFKLLQDKATTHSIFPPDMEGSPPTPPESLASPGSFQNIGNAALYEPRIDFIKRQLESLLSVIDLEKDGKIITPDGFRLKDLKEWQIPSAGDPAEIFGYAASRCNADCVFCYNRGDPPTIPLGNLRRKADEEFEEIRTRLKYFSPRAGLSLFPSQGNLCEVLIHPHIMEILRLLREKTAKVFRIATNGFNLTPDTISALAELQPIYLYLALNSASPERHRRLMRNGNPETAINALPLLREKGIPYAIVIVPWPLDSLTAMLDDLTNTITYCQQYEPHLFQINLPGYSQYFSAKKLFDLDEVWSAIVRQVRKLRETNLSPIVAMPTLYEENLCKERKNLPMVIGLVRNSPAARSKLRLGDRLLEINGLAIATRPQARDILSRLRNSGTKEVNFVIQRDGQKLPVRVNTDDSSYPYSQNIDPHLGIIFLGMGFRVSYIERLKELIDSHRAKHVLFLSSTLVQPIFEQSLKESHLLGDSRLKLEIEVPDNNFFGGNVFMGDLLVVQDFIDHIEKYLSQGKKKPDLIVIPSSPFQLGQWKRDITGRVYLDIERKVGIPVELLELEPIYE
ncbi:radical SAM protein [Chloroflexota bacterium]